LVTVASIVSEEDAVGRAVFWCAVLAAVVAVAITDIPPAYVFAPLLAVVILWFGFGSLRSLQRGGAHIPDGDPEVVDHTVERTTYWCAGCGAEVLLLVRGTDVPPRHCGERMHERIEIQPEPRHGER
jgi:DNA-directed RNA polymerase subunit RPC12/RpoP